MSNKIEHAARVPWQKDFPDVFNFCTVEARDTYEAYKRAKYAKCSNQALELMAQLSHTKQFKQTVANLKTLSSEDVIIAPVQSLERTYDPRRQGMAVGSNPLPMAIALAIAAETGWEVTPNIVQTNIVGHTGADIMARFTHPALFGGCVEDGRQYLIVDDHVGMGGTVANCRGYIESRGGQVIGISALSCNRSGSCVRLTPHKKNRLFNAENFATIGCHAEVSESVFGYSLDCLTNAEASQIFNILAEAKERNSAYNLQNFFNDVIRHRQQQSLQEDFKRDKQAMAQKKLDGSFTRGDLKHSSVYYQRSC